MVGHTFEYNPAVWKIQELLDAGALGELFYIYSNRVNLGRVQTDINALWSIAPHDVSILLALLKTMPVSVSAHGATYVNHGVEDVVFALLQFSAKHRRTHSRLVARPEQDAPNDPGRLGKNDRV